MSTQEMDTVTRESLQGWVPQLNNENDLRAAVEQAFDYRGDITLTLSSGETVVGFVYDRKPAASLAASLLRIQEQETRTRRSIPYSEITSLSFSGRDTAAGKSWEAWVKKFEEKKAAGETNIGLQPDEHE